MNARTKKILDFALGRQYKDHDTYNSESTSNEGTTIKIISSPNEHEAAPALLYNLVSKDNHLTTLKNMEIISSPLKNNLQSCNDSNQYSLEDKILEEASILSGNVNGSFEYSYLPYQMDDPPAEYLNTICNIAHIEQLDNIINLESINTDDVQAIKDAGEIGIGATSNIDYPGLNVGTENCDMTYSDGEYEDPSDPNFEPNEVNSESDESFNEENDEPNVQAECDDIGIHETPLESEEIQIRKRKRRNVAAPAEWKKNVRKASRQNGQTYTSARGKSVPARSIKSKDCSKCPRKCNVNFNEDDRIKIHNSFWAIGDTDKQKQYLSSLVLEVNKTVTRTIAENSRRFKTKKYNLIKGKENIQVCQSFFLATFDVSETYIRNIVLKRNEHHILPRDQRGHTTSSNKRPDAAKQVIVDHIKSFPTVPSHYCRKDSSKKYLPPDLNLQIMFDLYLEHCSRTNVQPEKLWYYRQIFKSNFNLAFHVPRKDMCDRCFVFDNLSEVEKNVGEAEHAYHLRRKNASRDMKNILKDKAIKGECKLAEFDLEAVCYVPKTNNKKIFYKRRYSVYNLTVFNVASKHAACYMWHETIAKRGSIEIASCLWDYLQKEADGKPQYFFSDTCSGQNRNINVTSMFFYAVQNFNIPEINQVFFEPGHSQMECDSVHAHIEKKNINLYHPSGWYTAVQMASKKSKYHVIEMDQSKFYNFSKIQKHFIKNKKVTSDGQILNWLKIKLIKYKKSDPEHIYFKYDLEDENYLKLEVIRRSQRTKGQTGDVPILQPAYNAPLPIKHLKLQNLKELCNDGTIKKQYHDFYNSLYSISEVNRRDSDSE